MSRPYGFDAAVMRARPRLVQFARKLSKNSVLADDLVQDTILTAIAKYEQFQPGTNLNAWLFTIMRNGFYSRARKGGREIGDPDGALAATLTCRPDQGDAYDLQIILGRMEQMPAKQRMALELVAMDGLEYEEAAEILGIPAGTVKSQVSRARAALASFGDYGRDRRQ